MRIPNLGITDELRRLQWRPQDEEIWPSNFYSFSGTSSTIFQTLLARSMPCGGVLCVQFSVELHRDAGSQVSSFSTIGGNAYRIKSYAAPAKKIHQPFRSRLLSRRKNLESASLVWLSNFPYDRSWHSSIPQNRANLSNLNLYTGRP